MLDTESTNEASISVGNELDLDINVSDAWELLELESLWKDLESRACSNAFLSWSWVKPWLAGCSVKPMLIQAKLDGEVVGLGLLHTKTQRLFPGISIKKLWLHRSGCQTQDQIWIEHNDFLLDQGFANQVREGLLNYLFSAKAGFDDVFLGLTASNVSKQIEKTFSYIRTDIKAETYLLHLSGFESLDDYLKSLSKNTRSQIVRSKKLLEEKYGPVTLSKAVTTIEKKAFLQSTAELHRQRWAEDEYGSGFDNPKFNQFHTEILTNDTGNTATMLFCLKAGEQELGYIYLLMDADSWKFYLSALNLEDDNRIKVGLLFHALVVEKAIEAGVKHYDFLAGEARYKKSLSDTLDYQSMLCIYRPTLLIRFRETLRSIKRFYIKKKAYYVNR